MDDEIVERFVADVEDFVASVEEAADQTQELATAADETQASLDGVRDSAAGAAAGTQEFADAAGEAKDAAGGMRDGSAEAAVGMDAVRDSAGEAAAAVGLYGDEAAKARDGAAGFAAAAELEAAALGHVRDEAVETAVALKAEKEEQKGFLSNLMSGLGSGGGLSGLLEKIPLIGGSLSKITEGLTGLGEEGTTAAESLGKVAGGAAGLVPVAVGIGAAATEATALATGFTAAGLGVGSFALLALPTLKTVFGAVGDTKAQLDKLPAPIRQAVEELKSVKTQFSDMAKAFQAPVLQLFSQALQIVSGHMDLLSKFANAALPGIKTLLDMLGKGLDSDSFKQFTDYMEKLSSPAIKAIGSGMAGIAQELMKLLTMMSQKDVINGINIAFRLLGAALQTVYAIVKVSMGAWDLFSDYIRISEQVTRAAADGIKTAMHDIASAFDTVRHAVATAGHDIASAFDTVRGDVAKVANAIVSGLTTAVNWIQGHWKDIAGWLADPVGMAVSTVKSHITDIEKAFSDLTHDVESIITGLGKQIETGWDNIRHNVAAAADAIPGDVEKAWDTVKNDTVAAFDAVLKSVEGAWKDITSSTSAGYSNVIDWFKKLPGEVISTLAALPGDMLTIGKNVIDGLINGIKDAAADIPGIMKGLASDVASYFTDPLKILSPSLVFFEHGANIVRGLINGVKAYAPQALAAMRELGTGIGAQGVGAAGAIAPAGGGTSVHVTVPVTAQGMTPDYNDPRFLQYMQAAVQEATLRYGQTNPGNGFTSAWGR